MGKKITLVATIVVLLLGTWIFYHEAWIASRSGVDSPLYSVERFDPYGTAALYRLMKKQGHVVRLLRQPHIADDMKGVMIEVLPVNANDGGASSAPATQPTTQPANRGYHNPSKLPVKQVLDWVSRGNTLIQLTRARTAIMDRLAIAPWTPAVKHRHAHKSRGAAQAPAAPSATMLEKRQRHGVFPKDLFPVDYARWLPGARQAYHLTSFGLAVRLPQYFARKGPRGWTPLASVRGRVIAGRIRHGKGTVIIVGAPTPALNHALGRGGNLNFLLQVIGNKPVIFNAWAHHLGEAGTLMGLIRRFGLLPALLQLILLALVYHWSTRGIKRVQRDHPPRPRSSVEQIQTLGYLYQQAMKDQDATERAVAEVRRRVACGLRCRVDQIQARLPHVDPSVAKQAQHLLEAAQQITGQRAVRCSDCGYDLRGSTRDTCPECGCTIERSKREQLAALKDAPPAHHTEPKHRSLFNEVAALLTESHDFATKTTRGTRT